MKVTSDRKIRVSPAETLTISGGASLNVGAQSGETITFAVPNPGVFLLHAMANGPSEAVSFVSDRGGDWKALLDLGLNVFEIVVEPEPDEWFCPNPNQPPMHPVSKGDVTCQICGMGVKHG